MQQESDDDDSAEALDAPSPNEPRTTQPQGVENTALNVKNLGHAQIQKSPSGQKMYNMSLQFLRSVSSDALGPANTVGSTSSAASQDLLKKISA